MIVLIILAGAVCATLLVRYLARESLPAAEDGPDDARRTSSAHASHGRPAPAARPCCSGPDLVEDERSAWTALDDHQLNRLLKESSS